MTLEEIRDYALSLPGVTEDIKWENHLCFCVGEKMFLITNPDEFPVTASFKTSDELFESLITHEGIIPAPYMARNKWVRLDNINRLNAKGWKELIDLAYQLVFLKLPKKKQNQITEK
jgi:predicted DNA-binding protein (MmcQ/YjbR family)